MRPVAVVHAGAGSWSRDREAAVEACRAAATAAQAALLGGGSALDAAVAAVRVLEDDPSTNAGTGATLTRDGTLELDASVMDGATGASGAVATLPPFRHPVEVARAVLTDGRYHLLCGEGAARFAEAVGFAPADPAEMIVEAPRDAGNTVGAVALDQEGCLAAATSTGGLAGAVPGRVGDSPIVGAGTYATRQAACSCTGDGEAFARACAAFWTTEHVGQGAQVAAEAALARVRDDFDGLGGLILVDHAGEVAAARTSPCMPHAIVLGEEPVRVGT